MQGQSVKRWSKGVAEMVWISLSGLVDLGFLGLSGKKPQNVKHSLFSPLQDISNTMKDTFCYTQTFHAAIQAQERF